MCTGEIAVGGNHFVEGVRAKFGTRGRHSQVLGAPMSNCSGSPRFPIAAPYSSDFGHGMDPLSAENEVFWGQT